MENPDFGNLPEGCISHVIGFTSPAEACRSALVSTLFRSASVSDAVWGKFLPEDYSDILSGAVSPVHFSSKKELYFRLCDPILIDHGKMSFWLEKLTGKKCYMLSARELWITWGDTPRYWEWTALPESRFSEVAELLSVCWLEIIGKFKTRMLSPKTTYVVYLVLKLHPHAAGLQNPPAELSVRLGDQVSTDTAHLQPNSPRRPRFLGSLARLSIRQQMQMSASAAEGRVPRVRGDAWMELELGEFFNGEGEDGEVEMSLREVKGGNWKRGLIIQGIEIRPKVESSQ